MAGKYRPEKIRCLFIAESPPEPNRKTGNFGYFYKEEYFGSDILFTHTMEALYGNKYTGHDQPKTKFLQRFCDEGYFLIDLSEEPVKHLDDDEKNRILEKERNILISICNLTWVAFRMDRRTSLRI